MFTKDQIASILIMVEDQKQSSHSEWLRNLTAQMEAVGSLEKAWNGRVEKTSGDIPDVFAWISQSRWLATCPFCNSQEGVDPIEKIFFCMNCDMVDNGYSALPVIFPDPETIAQITAVLLERPVKFIPAPTRYERIIRQVPIIYKEINGKTLGLGRSWTPDQTVEDLHAEQDDLIALWKLGGSRGLD